MANLRIIVVLACLIAWWQKDTLEDRALTQEGPTATAMQLASRTWSDITPPSPAKAWTTARDLWLSDLFNPKQDYSHPTVAPTPAVLDKPAVKASNPVSAPGAIVREGTRPSSNNSEKAIASSNTSAGSATLTTPSAETPSAIMDNGKTEHKIKRILIVGDSMSGDVGLSLRQLAFKYKQRTGLDIQIVDAHRHSTGLVVPSYYDWPRELPVLITRNEPQVVVFMAGANDGQNMRLDNQSWVLTGSAGWASEYERRAKQVLAATPVSVKLVWLDLPPVRTTSLQEKTFIINSAVKNALAMCKNCVHLETRSTFGGDVYVENTPGNMLRSKDGVHYSRSGASFVAANLWKALGLVLYD